MAHEKFNAPGIGNEDGPYAQASVGSRYDKGASGAGRADEARSVAQRRIAGFVCCSYGRWRIDKRPVSIICRGAVAHAGEQDGSGTQRRDGPAPDTRPPGSKSRRRHFRLKSTIIYLRSTPLGRVDLHQYPCTRQCFYRPPPDATASIGPPRRTRRYLTVKHEQWAREPILCDTVPSTTDLKSPKPSVPSTIRSTFLRFA